jgi:formylglycine-generating enzyme required for sulfatase activity
MPDCPVCQPVAPPNAKFCPECGRPLAQAAPAPPQSQQVEKGIIANAPMSVEGGIHFGKTEPTAAGHIAAYLAWIEETQRDVRLNDIITAVARPDASPIPLDAIFVPLCVDFSIPEKLSLAAVLDERRKTPSRDFGKTGDQDRKLTEEERTQTRRVTVWETVAHHARLALVGDPGSGKSTVGQFLTIVLARARREAAILDRLSGWGHGALLPVPVVLRHFAAKLDPAKKGCAADFWRLLAEQFGDASKDPRWAEAIKEVAAKDGAIFLLDGWDETSDTERLATMAEVIVDLRKNAGAKCRFLLTSRPYAWDTVRSPTSLPEGLRKKSTNLEPVFRALLNEFPDHYAVAKFDAEQIDRFIENWYQATHDIWRLSDAEQKRDDLHTAAKRDDLQPVVENPLLLTLTAALSGTRLPDDRTDLFREIVELLLQRWTQTSGSAQSLAQAIAPLTLQMQHLRERIEQCAFDAHRGNVTTTGAADIPEGALSAAIAPLLGGSKDKADAVIAFIEQRAGLLIGKGHRDGSRQFSCPHRAFQEFLAGCFLARQESFAAGLADPLSAASLSRAHPGHWREVLCFAARTAGSQRGAAAADALVHGADFPAWSAGSTVADPDWRNAGNAAKMLREIGTASLVDDVGKVRLARIRGWLAGLIERGGLADAVRERVDAGVDLAALGDTREGVGVLAGLPRFDWCLEKQKAPFPKGPFVMGGDAGEEKRQRTIAAPFRISRYPVTVAQFAAFIAAGGYEANAQSREWWAEGWDWKTGKGDEKKRITGPADYDAIYQTPNHPRVGVSWYEAQAFCRWLDSLGCATLGLDAEALGFEKGAKLTVRMPTETEWERAARGEKNGKPLRAWPWEAKDENFAERCNCSPAGIGHTSAVGLFPDGNTPEGIADLSGNVWEWCEDWYDEKKKEYRVVRGGSFNNDEDGLSPANRNNDTPTNRNHNIGFRVVVACSASARTWQMRQSNNRRDARWHCAAGPEPRSHLTAGTAPRSSPEHERVVRKHRAPRGVLSAGKTRGGPPWPQVRAFAGARGKVTAAHANAVRGFSRHGVRLQEPRRISSRALGFEDANAAFWPGSFFPAEAGDYFLSHPPVMRPISSIFPITKKSCCWLSQPLPCVMRQRTRIFSSRRFSAVSAGFFAGGAE